MDIDDADVVRCPTCDEPTMIGATCECCGEPLDYELAMALLEDSMAGDAF